ncbi:MAG: UbiX family flavin prenyltransferase [Parvibaculum sp.]
MAAKNPGLSQNNRLIIGISGASGVAYGVRALELLKAAGVETHLVMTKAAEMTLGYETGLKAKDVEKLAHTRYRIEDIGAGIASGSFKTMGMIVAPCSIRTMSEIATGVTSSLLTRAADVVLKERRRLVLMVRESPLHLTHLRNMVAVTEMGGIICPPLPAFYLRPQTVGEVVDCSVARVLDLIDVPHALAPRWQGLELNAP